MRKKIIHLLENITEEILVGALIAGCAVGSFVKNIEIKKPVPIERKIPEFSQEEIPEISFWDTLLLEEYIPPKSKPKFLTDVEIDNYLNDIYKKTEIPKVIEKTFVKSLINIESGKNIYALSPKGARGLMQLLPKAWNEVDDSDFYENCYNPQKNIEVGVKYLSSLYGYCRNKHSDWNEFLDDEKREIIAAAYNGGISRLEKNKWNIRSMPDETKDYIDSLQTSQTKSYQDSTKSD